MPCSDLDSVRSAMLEAPPPTGSFNPPSPDAMRGKTPDGPPTRDAAPTSGTRVLPVVRQNSVRRQVIDLSELIRRRSRLNGHSLAPPASTPPDALRRPPSGRPGEPCSTPPTRRLQEDGEPAEVAQQRSAVLGRVVQGVGGLEAGSRHRVTQHRPAVAAPPLPRVLGQTLRSPRGGTAARKPPDQGSRRTNGSGQSSLGRAANPWRTADAGNRRR